MRLLVTFIIVNAALAAPFFSAQAAGLAYVRASSQLQRVESPGTYHPLNLIDQDPSTLWCEGESGLGDGESVHFFFKRKQKINKLVITPAENTGRKILTVRLSDGVNSVPITLGSELTEYPLGRPLEGTEFSITVEKVGAANNASKLGGEVACIADILLYFGNSLFGGKSSSEKLHYDVQLDRLLGFWSGGPLGAPDRTIQFFVDGTWEWIFKPLLGGRSIYLSGEFRFRNNRLLLREGEVGRWNDVGFKYKRIKVQADDIGAPSGDYDQITANGVVHDKMAGEYNNARF